MGCDHAPCAELTVEFFYSAQDRLTQTFFTAPEWKNEVQYSIASCKQLVRHRLFSGGGCEGLGKGSVALVQPGCMAYNEVKYGWF